jgi:hypothetical protein
VTAFVRWIGNRVPDFEFCPISGLWHDAAVIASATPSVVPAGHSAKQVQPVLTLSSSLKLRPWRASDGGTLVAAEQDPAIGP